VRRPAPRPLAAALDGLNARIAPATVLARVQERWASAVGPALAARATPSAERDGVLTVLCDGSVWAQELELMAPQIIAGVNEALGEQALHALRCRSG
jgi:predicted nucleic acid-binding Zn ribbon protein